MISLLKGELIDKTVSSVVILTGGVGYEVFIPLSTFYDLPVEGAEASLFIKTVVRDDALELFGFLTRAEKAAFILLTSVSRIGPRLALSILSGVSPADLVDAVMSNNAARLSGAPGVGAKTAQRLIVELKDKIAGLAALLPKDRRPDAVVPPQSLLDDVGQDVVSALQNLGYTKVEAEKAVTSVLNGDTAAEMDDLGGLLRLSLKRLRKA